MVRCMGAFSPPNYLEARRWQGLRIGLLGGSFHPPHEGHIRLSYAARKLLGLDFVWWLVTPKNPIKDSVSIASYDTRVSAAYDMSSQYAHIVVSRFEHDLASANTYQTLRGLHRYFPDTAFVWLCGFDLALNFHRWQRAHDLPELAPFAFFARPPAYQLVTGNFLAMRKDLTHICLPDDSSAPELRARTIFWAKALPMHNISSTQLRTR